MKSQVIFILLSKWKTLEARTKKKVYLFLGLFSVITMAVGVFAVVLLVKAGSVLFEKTFELGQSAILNAPAIVNQQVKIPTEVAALGSLNVVNCSERLQSLLAIGPWLNEPLSQTFDSIVSACFVASGSAQSCTGPSCEQKADPEEAQ